MNTAEKIKVMQAFLDGEEIEVVNHKNNSVVTLRNTTAYEPVWNWEYSTYRVKEKDYSLPIPWELIDDSLQWAAMDDDGRVYFYKDKPSVGCTGWFSFDSSLRSPLKIETPDPQYWQNTLTKRPDACGVK